MAKLTDRELRERIGVTRDGIVKNPLYTIEGLTFSTSQTRRRVPTKTRVNGVKYWYTRVSTNISESSEDVLAQMVAYVEKQMKPVKQTPTAKDSK